MVDSPSNGFGEYPVTGFSEFNFPGWDVSLQIPEKSADAHLGGRLVTAVKKAAAKLPPAIGDQLLQLIEPKALLIMTGVVAVWASAQFYGVGEVADVVLVVVGRIAFGAAALSAGWELFQFAISAYTAKTDDDLDFAADHLVKAVSLITVQAVLAILLRKPASTFKDQFLAKPDRPNPAQRSSFANLPSNTASGYKPSITGTRDLSAGTGDTSFQTGDIRYSLFGYEEDRQLAIAHETVHKFLTPKLNLLRGLRGFLRAQGYNRSYILRYLEEALAETYSLCKVKGLARANVISGITFPVERGYVTIAKAGTEIRGLLLGPINVADQIFNVTFVRND